MIRYSNFASPLSIFILTSFIVNFLHDRGSPFPLVEAGSKSSKSGSKTTVIAINGGGGGGGKAHPMPVPWPIVHCHHHHHHLKYVPKPVLVHHWVKKYKPYEIEATNLEEQQVVLPNEFQNPERASSLVHYQQHQTQLPSMISTLPGNNNLLGESGKLPFDLMAGSKLVSSLNSALDDVPRGEIEGPDLQPTSLLSLPPPPPHTSPSSTQNFQTRPSNQVLIRNQLDKELKKLAQIRNTSKVLQSKQLNKLALSIAHSSDLGRQKKRPSALLDTEVDDSLKNVALANITNTGPQVSMENSQVNSVSDDSWINLATKREPAVEFVSSNEQVPSAGSQAKFASGKPSHPFDEPLDQLKDESQHQNPSQVREKRRLHDNNAGSEKVSSQQKNFSIRLALANQREQTEAARMFKSLSMEQTSRIQALNQFNDLIKAAHPSAQTLLPQIDTGSHQQRSPASEHLRPDISNRMAPGRLTSESYTIDLMTKLASDLAQIEANKLLAKNYQRLKRRQKLASSEGGKYNTSVHPVKEDKRGGILLRSGSLLGNLLGSSSSSSSSSVKHNRDKRRVGSLKFPLMEPSIRYVPIAKLVRNWPNVMLNTNAQQRNSALNRPSGSSLFMVMPLHLNVIGDGLKFSAKNNSATALSAPPASSMLMGAPNDSKADHSSASISSATAELFAAQASRQVNKVLDPSTTNGRGANNLPPNQLDPSTADIHSVRASQNGQYVRNLDSQSKKPSQILLKLNENQSSAVSSWPSPFATGTRHKEPRETTDKSAIISTTMSPEQVSKFYHGQQNHIRAVVVKDHEKSQNKVNPNGAHKLPNVIQYQIENLSRVKDLTTKHLYNTLPSDVHNLIADPSQFTQANNNLSLQLQDSMQRPTGSVKGQQIAGIQGIVEKQMASSQLESQQPSLAHRAAFKNFLETTATPWERQRDGTPPLPNQFYTDAHYGHQSAFNGNKNALGTPTNGQQDLPAFVAVPTQQQLYPPQSESTNEQSLQTVQHQHGNLPSYLEFPISPHQWSAEALRSMNEASAYGDSQAGQQEGESYEEKQQLKQQMDSDDDGGSGDSLNASLPADSQQQATPYDLSAGNFLNMALATQPKLVFEQHLRPPSHASFMPSSVVGGDPGKTGYGMTSGSELYQLNMNSGSGSGGLIGYGNRLNSMQATTMAISGHHHVPMMNHAYTYVYAPPRLHGSQYLQSGSQMRDYTVLPPLGFQPLKAMAGGPLNMYGQNIYGLTSIPMPIFNTPTGSANQAFTPMILSNNDAPSGDYTGDMTSSSAQQPVGLPKNGAKLVSKGKATGVPLGVSNFNALGSLSGDNVDPIDTATNDMNQLRQFQSSLSQNTNQLDNSNITAMARLSQQLRDQIRTLQQRLPQMPQMPNIPQPPQIPNLPMPPPGMMQMAGLALPFAMARATRNANRNRNQQVNAAANGGGTTAGQRLILGASNITNRLMRSRRRPTSQPGSGGSVMSGSRRPGHRNKGRLSGIVQAMVDISMRPPMIAGLANGAASGHRLKASALNAAKMKPKVDQVGESKAKRIGRALLLAWPPGSRRELQVSNSTFDQSNNIVVPGSPLATVNDGGLTRFASMTSPVDLLAQQLTLQQRLLRAADRQGTKDQMTSPSDSHQYQVDGLKIMGPLSHSNYELSNADLKPLIFSQDTAVLPLPMVANHINLLLFTAHNVTGNLLKSSGSQNDSQESNVGHQASDSGGAQVDEVGPPSGNPSSEPGQTEQSESSGSNQAEGQQGVQAQPYDEENQSANVAAAAGQQESGASAASEASNESAPQRESGGGGEESQPGDQYQAEAEITKKNEPTDGQMAPVSVVYRPEPSTFTPIIVSNFKPMHILTRRTTQSPTTTTTTTSSPTASTRTTPPTTTTSSPTISPSNKSKGGKKSPTSYESWKVAKSKRSTERPVKGQQQGVGTVEQSEDHVLRATAAALTSASDVGQKEFSTSSQSATGTHSVLSPVSSDSFKKVVEQTSAGKGAPGTGTGSSNVEVATQESESKPGDVGQVVGGPSSSDYVRAIKLVREIAYPWPPPTKSSKLFDPAMEPEAILVV